MVYTTGYKDGSGNDLSTVFVHSDTKTSNSGKFELLYGNYTWWSINNTTDSTPTFGSIELQDKTSDNIITCLIDTDSYYYITTSVAGIYSIDMNIIYTSGTGSDSNPTTFFAFTTKSVYGGTTPDGIMEYKGILTTNPPTLPGYISYNSSSRAVNNPNTGGNYILEDPKGIGSVFYVHTNSNGDIDDNFCTISSTIYLPKDTKLYFSFASTDGHYTKQKGSFFINLLKAL